MNPESPPSQGPRDDIRIREATVQDLAVVIHHRRAMFEEMRYGNGAELDAMQEASEQFFGAALADGSYRGWFAESPDGRIIAGSGVGINPWPPRPYAPNPYRATIFNVYTEPEFRHRGIARSLMLVMIEWCRKAGFSQVNLHASEFGRSLYTTLGFVPTNEMRLSLITPPK